MSPAVITLGVFCSLVSVPAVAASPAPSREFRAAVERAERAAAAGDHTRAAEAYDAAYERLTAAQRASATGTDVVLESTRARRAAFAGAPSDTTGLRAAQSLLERHLGALKTAASQTSTAELDRELAEIRAALAEVTKREAATSAGPWYLMLNGQVAGPFAKDVLAESYLDGVIDDATLIQVSEEEGWVPLAKSTIFPALDRWYLGRDTRWLGPMSRATLLKKVAEVEATGFDSRRLSVRLEWAEQKHVPYGDVERMLARPPLEATTPTTLAVRDYESAPEADDERESEGEPTRKSSRVRQSYDFDNGRARFVITPRIGIALPGTMSTSSIPKAKLGVGFPLQLDAVGAPLQFLELGGYFHYSVRKINKLGSADVDGRVHLVSVGALLRAKIPTSHRSRLRLGVYFGYNHTRQKLEGRDDDDNEVTVEITGEGINLGPSLDWSIDVARAVAFNVQLGAMTQVWGEPEDDAVDVPNPTLVFPPLAFFAIGLDFYVGQRK